MLDKVKNFAKKWQMFSSEDRVIVGVSGGADSVCLLLVLLELKQEIGFDVVAVHVNHCLRGTAADADEAYVKEFCKERGVRLEVCSADVKSIARERKQSTEEAGRDVRRDFFEQVYFKYHGTKIALAHHQNDNAETFLFRLARGTGLKGLVGMKAVSGQYVRPLLCVTRNEIEEYLGQHGIVYCVDATNEENIYARNLIRNQVIPQMEDGVNSKTVEHINKTMEQMRQIQSYLEEQTRKYFEYCVTRTASGYCIHEELYRNVPEVLRLLLIRDVMVCISEKEKDLEEIHFKQTEELFEKQSGRKIDLPYHMEARRVYEGVEICRRAEKKDEFTEELFLDLDQLDRFYQWQDYEISCRLLNKMQIDGETLEKSNTKRFDCDIIKGSICLRTRRPGDYITIHPEGNTQKLKTFFINQKIPKEKRDKILLVADGSHILWVVGYRVNGAYQVKEHTENVIELQINKGEGHGRDN